MYCVFSSFMSDWIVFPSNKGGDTMTNQNTNLRKEDVREFLKSVRKMTPDEFLMLKGVVFGVELCRHQEKMDDVKIS